MVGALSLALVLLASLGASDSKPVSMSMTVVQATNENRGSVHYDASLRNVKGALAGLGYDTYRKLTSTTITAPLGKETKAAIGAKYTLHVKPLSRELSGQVRINLQVKVKPKNPRDKPKNALATTLAVTPGKPFKLRGLKSEKGELVIVMSVKAFD